MPQLTLSATQEEFDAYILSTDGKGSGVPYAASFALSSWIHESVGFHCTILFMTDHYELFLVIAEMEIEFPMPSWMNSLLCQHRHITTYIEERPKELRRLEYETRVAAQEGSK